jgi:PAS domain-containing protein
VFQVQASDKSLKKSHSLLHRSLSKDMILSLTLVVLLTASILVGASYLILSRQTHREYQQKANELESYLQKSLELPLWNVDEISIRKVCEAIVRNDLISKLQVVDASGKVIFSHDATSRHELIERSGSIDYEGEKVGQVHLSLTTRIIEDRIRQILGAIIATFLAILLSLIGATGLLIRFLLHKPLKQVIFGIERIAQGEYDYQFKRSPQMEIAAIVSKFEKMAQQIKKREGSLTRMNEKLKHEVSERKDAEAALREAFRKSDILDHIVNRSPAVAFSWLSKPDWPTDYVSENVRQFGYTPEDFRMGRIAYKAMVHHDDIARITEQIEHFRDQKRVESFIQSYRIITRDGRTLWVDDRSWFVWDEDGSLLHLQVPSNTWLKKKYTN